MGPVCVSSALRFQIGSSRFVALVASLLIAQLAILPAAYARAKPLDAATVHERIVKRGIEKPIGVELNDGVELVGRLIAINPDSFTLQLFNDPQPVTLSYADVVDLRTGPGRGFWIYTGVGIGAAVGLTIWGVVHLHNFEQDHQIPNMPPLPAAR
jgi:hypothetical protein